MKLSCWVLLALVPLVASFDVIREAFKQISDEIQPCENFYRHACPAEDWKELWIEGAYAEKMFNVKAKTASAPWNNLEFEKTFRATFFIEIGAPSVFISSLFLSECENENVTITEKEQFLVQLQHALHHTNGEKCDFDFCLKPLARDKNCTRAAGILGDRLASSGDYLMTDGQLFEAVWTRVLRSVKEVLFSVNAIIIDDLRDGVVQVKELVDDIVNELVEEIEKTPWVENNNATRVILETAKQVHLYDNFAKVALKSFNFAITLEQEYLKCLKDTKYTPVFETFCMFVAALKTENKASLSPRFFTFFNAMNSHPNLYFSHLFYDMAKNVGEKAALLGSVGYIAGHEVSHTMIENANFPVLIPYFSNESMQCIQGQFQKTCDSFKEISCGAADNQIDENGADMLGMRLAYRLLEKHYGFNVTDNYIEVQGKTVTIQQLFFYSTAFVSCHGAKGQQFYDPHSPWNIRINAIMQIPEFRTAFQCDADSEMVQSFADECPIFGENAPETRK